MKKVFLETVGFISLMINLRSLSNRSVIEYCTLPMAECAEFSVHVELLQVMEIKCSLIKQHRKSINRFQFTPKWR